MKTLIIILLALFCIGCGSSVTSTVETADWGIHRELSPAAQAK